MPSGGGAAVGDPQPERTGMANARHASTARTSASGSAPVTSRMRRLATLPYLETVRGAARRGQTERAECSQHSRVVKHDLGTLELRAEPLHRLPTERRRSAHYGWTRVHSRPCRSASTA